jgi:uncharacterized protein YdiU (UPF0061 family)
MRTTHGHICNHSDHARPLFAYDRTSPAWRYWNLFCLGQALLPLIGEVDDAMAALNPSRPSSRENWLRACAPSWA